MITDKFIFSDGSIRQLDGTIVQQPNDFNEQRYNQAEPIPNKFLYPDGTIKDKDKNLIESATEFRHKQYSQAVPIPAKFLHADGTVDENIGGGTSLQYKLYAWEVSIDHASIGYTEIEDVEAGDVLLIPENTGTGPITNTNQLKQKGLVKSVSGNHITVEIVTGFEVVFERSSANDWTETITDIKGTLDISQNGLLVAEKGKVMKALDILAGGSQVKTKISKLIAWYYDSETTVYTLHDKDDGLQVGDFVIHNIPELPEYAVVEEIVTGGPGGYGIGINGYEYKLPRRSIADIEL